MAANPMPGAGVTRAAFKREVRTWARHIGVQPKEVHLRQLKTKQASCSLKGRITFTTALLTATPSTRTEAIVHELVHLKVPNHGKLFKKLLQAFLNNYG
jgi:hypothetical protein